MRAVVLGAGLGGLAVAARLARQRHDVTVLEVDPAPFKAGSPPTGQPSDVSAWSHRGHARETDRFAIDPPTLWLPAVYRDLFRKTGRPLEQELELLPVDPARRYVFPDGAVLDLPTGNRAQTLDAFGRAFGPAAAREWDALLTTARSLWEDVRRQLVSQSEAPRAAAYPERGRRPLARFRNLWEVGASELTDPRSRLVLEHYAHAAGAEARLAAVELLVLPYLEHAFGSWQVAGGMPALRAAIRDRARLRGTTLRTVDGVAGTDAGPDSPAVLLRSGERLDADVLVDARPGSGDRADGPGTRSASSRASIAVAGCTTSAAWPIETVILAASSGRAVVLARPNLQSAPGLVTVSAELPDVDRSAPTDLAARLRSLARQHGYEVDGDVVGVATETFPPASSTSARQTRSRRVGVLALRRPLRRPESTTSLIEDPDGAGGVLRVGTAVRGAAGVPLLGLSAAVVAERCGIAPRTRRTPTTPAGGGAAAADDRSS